MTAGPELGPRRPLWCAPLLFTPGARIRVALASRKACVIGHRRGRASSRRRVNRASISRGYEIGGGLPFAAARDIPDRIGTRPQRFELAGRRPTGVASLDFLHDTSRKEVVPAVVIWEEVVALVPTIRTVHPEVSCRSLAVCVG